MRGKGAAPVLGLVLLIGFVVAGALAVFAVGATVVDSSQSDVEETQLERSMVAAAGDADDLATGDRSSADWSFDGVGEGTPRVDESSGRINVTQYVDGQPEQVVIDDAAMGTLTYEHDDVTYAYQAGAVWRLDDNGDPRLVRAPELHYRGQTLTFPFVNVTGDVTAGQTAGTMEVTETKDVYPDAPTDYNPLRNGTVVLEIESEYCEGWQSYFDQRTDGALIERCSVTDETVDGEVRVELVVPFSITNTDHSIMAGDINNQGNVDGDVEEVDNVTMPSATNLVEMKVEEAEEEGTYLPTNPGYTIDDGLYYADELDGGYTFDTTDGDVEVAVNGTTFEDIDNSDFIDIQGNGTVTIFARDEVLDDAVGGGSTTFGEEDETTQLRILVHSDVDEVGATNDELYAFVYAPNSHVDFSHASSMDFEGGVVADEFSVHNGDPDIFGDPVATQTELSYEFGGRSIYYLHVTETEIEFTGDDSD